MRRLVASMLIVLAWPHVVHAEPDACADVMALIHQAKLPEPLRRCCEERPGVGIWLPP